MWTVFFDDFCLFSEPALERSSDLAARSLFDLLGWAYDTSGEKNTVCVLMVSLRDRCVMSFLKNGIAVGCSNSCTRTSHRDELVGKSAGFATDDNQQRDPCVNIQVCFVRKRDENSLTNQGPAF